MQRRKFIAGLGSAAAAGAAGIGTGAVSQITADRDANLEIAKDRNAYLGLEAGSSPYVTESSKGTLQFNFDGSGTEASGLNNRADTVVEDAFTIKNQSDRDLYIWSGFARQDNGDAIDPTSGGARSVELLADGTDITYPGSEDKSTEKNTSRVLGQTTDAGAIKLGSGTGVDVDIRLLVYGSNDPRDASFLTVFRADEDDPTPTEISDHEFDVNL